MSTRAQIFVMETVEDEDGMKRNQQVFNFYHHYDGYMVGVGKELYQALVDTVENFDENEGLFPQLEQNIQNQHTLGLYEPEHNNPDAHGDVEFIYTIVFAEDDVIVAVETRHLGEDAEEHWASQAYTIESFKEEIDRQEAVIAR